MLTRPVAAQACRPLPVGIPLALAATLALALGFPSSVRADAASAPPVDAHAREVQDAIVFQQIFVRWWALAKKRMVTLERRPRAERTPTQPLVTEGRSLRLKEGVRGRMNMALDSKKRSLVAKGAVVTAEPEVITLAFEISTPVSGKLIAGEFAVSVPDFMVPVELMRQLPNRPGARIKVVLPKSGTEAVSMKETLLGLGLEAIFNQTVRHNLTMDGKLWNLLNIPNPEDLARDEKEKLTRVEQNRTRLADLASWIKKGHDPTLQVRCYDSGGPDHADAYLVERTNPETHEREQRLYYFMTRLDRPFLELWERGESKRRKVVTHESMSHALKAVEQNALENENMTLVRDIANEQAEIQRWRAQEAKRRAYEQTIERFAQQFKGEIPHAIAQGNALGALLDAWSKEKFKGAEYLDPFHRDHRRGQQLIRELQRGLKQAEHLQILLNAQPTVTFYDLVAWAKRSVAASKEGVGAGAWLDIEPIRTAEGVLIKFTITPGGGNSAVRAVSRTFLFRRSPSDAEGISDFSTIRDASDGTAFLKALGVAVKKPWAIFKEHRAPAQKAVRKKRRSSSRAGRQTAIWAVPLVSCEGTG